SRFHCHKGSASDLGHQHRWLPGHRRRGGIIMNPQEWRLQLGECVRDLFRSPEMEQFYNVKLTQKRAQIYLLQLSLYVRKRRDFWPQVAANCPEFDVKQRIMSHEYEELIEDEHSKHGHLDLIFRQGKEV